jgi:hypothetical protein
MTPAAELAIDRSCILRLLRRTLATQLEITRDQLAVIAKGDRRQAEGLGLEAIRNRGRIAIAVVEAKLVGMGHEAARLVRRNDRRRDAMIEGSKR